MKFVVYGTPIPQGSTRAFIPKGWKRPIITNANKKTKPWRQEIAGACLAELRGNSCAGRGLPMSVLAKFYFARPKSVNKLAEKTTKPDIDKLARALLDALTGIAFEDDSQVTDLRVEKCFGLPERAEIEITEAGLPPSKAVLYKAIKNEELPF